MSHIASHGVYGIVVAMSSSISLLSHSLSVFFVSYLKNSGCCYTKVIFLMHDPIKPTGSSMPKIQKQRPATTDKLTFLTLS